MYPINNCLEYSRIELIPSTPYHFECCATEIIGYNLLIVCIYRTPTSNPSIFLKNFELLTRTLTRKKNKKVILCGDWNIDLLKKKQTDDRTNIYTRQ